MGNSDQQKKIGRPVLERKRTARLSMRTYPEIEEKARRVGTKAVEDAIRAIPDVQQKARRVDIEALQVVDELGEQ